MSEFLDKDEYIELIFGQQRVRLYIVAGVKDDTSFAPLTKKEISVRISFPLSFSETKFLSSFVGIPPFSHALPEELIVMAYIFIFRHINCRIIYNSSFFSLSLLLSGFSIHPPTFLELEGG